MADDLFALLTDADRRLIFQGARNRTYRRGENLFREGEAQPNLYVLRKGQVRVERQYQGRGLAVARYGVGAVVGEISFLQQRPAQGSVVAEEDVEVDVLEAPFLQGLLASDTGFAARFYHALANCLGERLVQILPGIRLLEAFGGAGTRSSSPRSGQLSERQLPAELTAGVSDFWSAMRALGTEADPGPSFQARVNQTCDSLVTLLTRFTADDALVEVGMDDLLSFRDLPDLARGVGGYVLREAFPFLMQSATISLGFERPRGYAEDRELLERIERAEPEGDGRLGPAIDRWFLDRPLCRARRNTLTAITRFLQHECATIAGAGPIRLTSLAAGTGQELFAACKAIPQAVYATALEPHADALVALTDRALAEGCADRITFLQADLLALARGHTTVSLGPQHVIYGLGVCDYLDDEQVSTLLQALYELLLPGGALLLTNRDTASPDRAMTEHLLDWPIVYRSAAQLQEIFQQSQFHNCPLEINHEAAGVTLIARCRKN